MTSTFSTARFFRNLFATKSIVSHASQTKRPMTNAHRMQRAVAESLESRLLMTGSPTHLVFSTGPTNTVAGDPIASILVSVEDAGNNVVTTDTSSVTLAVNTGPGSTAGQLFFAVHAVNGVATISGLSLTTAGAYTLSASDGALTPAVSNSFTISPDAASQLVFTAQPATTTAGLTIPTVAVSVEDQYGNVVTTDTSAVSLTPTGGGSLSGTTTENAVAGVATFADLSMTTAGSHTLGAADGALSDGASATFSVTPAAASQLAFVAQPTDTAAGANVSSITVAVMDQYGNVVTSDNSSVTLALSVGPGSIAGTLTTTAVNGIATFSDIHFTQTGVYSITSSDGALSTATSNTFNVTPAVAAKLAVTQQPAGGVAGPIGTVTVSVEDQFGNVLTGNTSNVTLALTGSNGTLLGTTTVTAVNGVATFSTLAIHSPGTFGLTATDGALTQATSSSFSVTPAAASKIVFVAQPVNIAAGVLPTVTVAVEDQFGNVVTSDSSTVTIAFNSGAGTLGGTLTQAAVNGVATFADLSVHTPNTFTIGATDGVLTGATSSSFTVTPAAATHLVFTQQPGNVSAGALGTVIVSVEDQYNNIVSGDSSTITLSVASGGGSLLGTVSAGAVNGVATFSNVSMHTAGTFTLGATDGLLSNAVSSSFTVSPTAATQLAFTQTPTSTVAGSSDFVATVAIEDQYGNVVTSSSANVGLAVTTGGQTFNLVVAASSGIASFNGISLVHAGSGSMRATSSGLTAANFNVFTITPAAASQVVITAQSTTGTAGAALTTFTAAVEDQYGNVVTTDTSTITLTAPVTLHGTTAVAAVNGVATFSNVSIQTVGSYAITASDGALTTATANNITISPAAASKVAFTTNTAGGVAGATLSNVLVSVEDQFGNVVTGDTSPVTLSIHTGNGTLGGTVTANAVSGVATFSTLAITATGTYMLGAADGSLTGGVSSSLAITPAVATHLAFSAAPAGTSAGTLGTVTVSVEDQYNNVVTNAVSNVTLSKASGPGSLLGTLTQTTVNGVATFSDLGIHTAGAYTIGAADGALTGTISGSFAITAAAASQLAFNGQPTNTVAGVTISPVTVDVEDQYGNVVTTDSSFITLVVNSGSGTLDGTVAVAAVNGVATFSALDITTADTYTLAAAFDSLGVGISSSFIVSPSAGDHYAIGTQPTDTVAGHTIGTVTVSLEDVFNNVLTGDSGTQVDLTVASGSGTLHGTATANDVNGVATFSGLSINTAGSYTLNASADTFHLDANNGETYIDTNTDSFNITPDAALQLAVTSQPTTTVAGQTISTVDVSVEDQYGNVVTTDNSNVTMTVLSGNGTVSGTANATAVNGVASFTDLSTTTADSYVLGFADGGLSSTTTSSFAVTADAATHLVVLSQPTDTVAGQTISTVTVAVEDQFGNVVTTDTSNVTLEAMESNVNGTTTEAAVNGIATFSDLSIQQAGETELVALDGGLNATVTNPFNIATAAADHLEIVTMVPGSYSADGINILTVVAEDQYGNQISGYTGNVTVSITSGNGTLSGTTTGTFGNGFINFLDLAIHQAGSYTLSFSDGTITDATVSFNVTPAGASKVVITQEPADTTAGVLGTVEATVEDQYGNVETGDTSDVTLALDSGGTLDGTLTVAANSGVATFNNLEIHTVGSYSMTASDGSLATDDSNTFNITPAAADHLVYTTAPASTTAGALGTVTVTVEDQFGNVVTGDTSNVSITIASGPGSLGGTLTVAAVNGVATFSDLSLHTAGDFTLTATDGLLGSTTSDTFTITPAAATHVAVIDQPGSTVAGSLGAVTVAVEDQYNNIVTADNSDITLSIASGPGSLLGTLTVADENGVATFSDLGIHLVGTYTLGAADGGLATDTSSSFTISPAASSQLVFSTQPNGGVAGATLSPVAVKIEDQYGNTATGDSSVVTLLFNAGSNSFTLNTAAVTGVATFSGFSVTKSGTFTFGATDGSLTGATSSNFTITPQLATHLAFIAAPSNGVTGPLGTVTVAIEDQFNNVATSSTSAVTIALATGSGTLGGTLTANAVNGVATFSDLYLHTPGSFSLAATGSFTSATTGTFSIVPGAATQMLITQQPANATAGTLGTVTVTLEDQYGNIATNDSTNVSAAIASGPGSIGGTTSAAVVNGVATFSNLAITTAGTYTLNFTDGSLSSGATNSFTVAAATASKLAILSGPSNTIAGNVAALTVAVEDAYGNLIASDNSAVTISVASGNGTLGGTLTVNAINGVASFSDLSLHTAGTYTLGFADGSLTGATSSSFTVSAAAADHLSYDTAPAGASAGTLNTIVVSVRDQFGNLETSDSSAVTLALASGSGTLGGTVTVNAVNGLATFSNVNIHQAGTYTLAATDGSLTSVTSGSIAIAPAAISHIAVISGPTDKTAGALGAISIAVEDQYNNIVTSSSAAVTIAISSGNASLGGTLTVNAVNGTATFTDLSITKAGVFTLAATSGIFTVPTASFTITPAAATQTVFITPPTNTANFNLNTITVGIEDQYGNIETGDTDPVALTIGSGNATLGGTTIVDAVNGVATFSDLTIARSGSYTLNASSGSLAPATSNSFNVAAKLAVTGQPTTTAAGTLPAITVQIQDTLGNLLTSDNSNVTLSFVSGPTATIGGTLTVQAVNGVATFSDLSLHTPGAYVFQVSDGVITTATTGTINITPAAASKVVITSGPANMNAGGVATLVAAVEDQYGNVVTSDNANVTLSLNGNATLGGTTTVHAVNGIATFAGISLTKTGSYSLTFTHSGTTSATSTSFTVAPAAAYQVVILTQPTNMAAGNIGTVRAAVEDQYGNIVTSDNSAVTVLLGGSAGPLGGTTTVDAFNGIATFSDLTLHAPGTYNLNFLDGGLYFPTSNNFIVTPAAANHLSILTSLSNGAAGPLPTITVVIQDQFNNAISSNAGNITLSLVGSNGTLGGTTTVAATNGLANFTNLSIHTPGTFTITATESGLVSDTTASFTITPAAATKLVVLTQPGNLSAGETGTYTVALEDQYGNVVTTSPTTVTATIGSGNATLGGTLSATTVNGVATFSNLSITKSGAYALAFTGNGLTAGSSPSFTIAPTATTHLAYTVQPSSTIAGVADAVSVAFEDQYNNIVTTNTGAIVLTPSSGTPVTVSATNGVAVFSNFTLTTAGNYTLNVTSGSMSNTSSAFTVSPAAATTMLFSTQPANTSSATIGTVAVTLEDAFGNVATNDNSTVTLAVATGPGAFTGTTTATVANGVATFTNLSLPSSGFYTISAVDGALTPATSVGFSVAAKVAITNQPTTSAAGAVPAITVALEDSAGNVLTGDSSPVTLTIATGPAGAQILGTVTVNAVNGVATFSNAVLPTIGTYTLTASDVSGVSATSAPITITPNTAAALAFLSTPGTATAGVKMGSFSVRVTDAYGNTVPTKTKTQMTLTVATGAGSTIALKGTVINGVATFSNGILKKAGTYTFVANFAGITAISGTVTVNAAAPKTVVFTQQPPSTTAGSPFSVAVHLVDSFGNVVTSATPVSLALVGKKGTLAGTLSVIAVDGTALFANLSITTPGKYNLKATAVGKSATSSKFTIA